MVAGSEEVGSCVEVRGYVLGFLGREVREGGEKTAGYF